MATVVNFIDVTLRGAAARTVNLASAQILLTASAPAFHVDADGVITPASITFTATRIDIDAPLAFNCTGATLTNTTATTVTLAGADMVGSSATVIASATVNGQTYTGPCTISKFKDGKDGVDGDGANLTAGDLKAILEGQITTDQLTAALTSRIGLIDGGADVAGSVTARVKAETDARIAAISQASTDNRTYVQQFTYSQQTINDSFSAFGTNIQAAYQGYANGAADGALAAAKSFAQSYSYSKADSDSSLTATANQLRSEFATLNQGAGATVAWVQEYAYSKAQANDAIASATQQLSTTVAGHTSTLEIQGQSISGLGAQYTVKIDNNGYMAGYGLASTAINGVPTSSFIVLADRFAVALPGQSPKFPFVIGTVNGQTVIGLRGDVVLDGTLNIRATSGLSTAIDAASATSTWAGTAGRPSDEAIRNNLVDLSSWVRLGSMPWPANGEYNVLANSLADFGVQGPKGVDDVIWYAEEKQINNNPNGDNPSGGWSDAPITLDPTKKYRFVLPIFRRAGSGWAYWGLRNVASLNGSAIVADNNPYFASSNSLTLGRWYLFVGYIFPANSVGNTNDSAGIWDCSTGEKVAGGTNYNFIPGTGTIYHRAYQYYASNGAQQLFGRPMVSLMDGAEPSLREYFAASALLNNQQQWGDVKGSNKPQDNATVGAPAGTKVGDTEAQQVVGWAYSGAVALSQVQTKIDANASNILRAPITITTGGGVVVGSLSYDATTGLRGGGSGIAITPFGIIGHDGSNYTFAISASGQAQFGGQLTAAYGTFGALRIASGGYIAQGAYSGAWAWPANGAGMGFLIHPNGILLGNANDPTKGYIQLDANLGELHMPGFDYAGRQLTLSNPVIINPQLTLGNRTVSISSPSGTSFTHGRTTTGGYCGSHTGSISGAVNPSYLWTITGYPGTQMIISGASSATCGLSVVGPGGRDTGGGPIDASYDLTCTVSDGGVTKSSTQTIWVTFT
ncbi:phage tail tip fiber protein [Massilia phyllosphaerae]|uniref:phage tail tip fiber protein n=1 Tax=Massilia phyllosphaerae TaxID=3106034 RepID=UPI002B1CBF22|nr:DUF1983 domain-containing protein [Massilia sp. SGZ-792]